MTIQEILKTSRVVAIVGVSGDPDKPSNTVLRYLRANGYKVYAVNPNLKEVMGQPVYPDLASIPERVDVVDIFRKPDDVPAIVEEAIKIGARVVWMQEGIVSQAGAERARRAGLEVVMDHCMRKEHLAMPG